jgi:hypothetical protein
MLVFRLISFVLLSFRWSRYRCGLRGQDSSLKRTYREMPMREKQPVSFSVTMMSIGHHQASSGTHSERILGSITSFVIKFQRIENCDIPSLSDSVGLCLNNWRLLRFFP